jgi:hypothetical protein
LSLAVFATRTVVEVYPLDFSAISPRHGFRSLRTSRYSIRISVKVKRAGRVTASKTDAVRKGMGLGFSAFRHLGE